MSEELKKLLNDIYGHSCECTKAIVRVADIVYKLLNDDALDDCPAASMAFAEGELETAIQELVQVRFHIEDYGEEADSASNDTGGTE